MSTSTKIKQWVRYDTHVPLTLIVPEKIELSDIRTFSNRHGEISITLNDGRTFNSSNCEFHDWQLENVVDLEDPSHSKEIEIEHGDGTDEDFCDPWN